MTDGTSPEPIERLAVIVAMRSELQHLPHLPRLPQAGEGPWPAVTWQQGHVEVTAVLCGIGMIRAAAATEATIHRHRPDAVLNFGCTGAHRRDVNIGDVIIGTRAVPHATMIITPEGVNRYHLHDNVDAPGPGETGIPADPGLLAIARHAASGWLPEPWRAESPAPRVLEGVVASADVWTQSHAGIEAISERHLSLCEDMEAAAIATISALHGVPFLTIKDISNNELQQATIFDPEGAHLPEAEVGRRAAELTGRVIAAIAQSTDQDVLSG